MKAFLKFSTILVSLLYCSAALAQPLGQGNGPGPLPPSVLLGQANTWSATQTFADGGSWGSTGISNLTVLGLGGNISGSGIFGTTGIKVKNAAATLNDTTSSGTLANNYNNLFGGNTQTATSATTITNNYGSFFVAPTCSTNVTCTNNWAMGTDSINVVTKLAVGGAGGTITTAASTTASTSGARITWNVNASSTVPVFIPNATDTTTGLGAQASGNMSAIVGGAEVVRYVTGGMQLPGALIATGSSPTGSGTCTRGAQTGGNTTGTIVLTCTAQTLILTFATTAPTGWMCEAFDQTTTADTMKQTANSTTTCTLTGTTAASDVVLFQARAY